MLVAEDRPASLTEIKAALEGSDNEAKIGAMKKAVQMLLNGEQMPQLFITIVRYVLPCQDHTVQKRWAACSHKTDMPQHLCG